jgi:hypothetical protein
MFSTPGGLEELDIGPHLLGREPRLAQRLAILFFWPIRASSANQTSIAPGINALLAPDLFQARGKAFLKSSIAPSA